MKNITELAPLRIAHSVKIRYHPVWNTRCIACEERLATDRDIRVSLLCAGDETICHVCEDCAVALLRSIPQ